MMKRTEHSKTHNQFRHLAFIETENIAPHLLIFPLILPPFFLKETFPLIKYTFSFFLIPKLPTALYKSRSQALCIGLRAEKKKGTL